MKKKIALILAAVSAIMMLVIPVSAAGGGGAAAVTMPDPATIVTPEVTNSFLSMIWGFVPILLPIALGMIAIFIILKLIKRFTK